MITSEKLVTGNKTRYSACHVPFTKLIQCYGNSCEAPSKIYILNVPFNYLEERLLVGLSGSLDHLLTFFSSKLEISFVQSGVQRVGFILLPLSDKLYFNL